MMIVGRLIGRIDTRLLLAFGLGLTAWSFYIMTGWTPDVSQATIVAVGVLQRIGLGFLFVPLSAMTLQLYRRSAVLKGLVSITCCAVSAYQWSAAC